MFFYRKRLNKNVFFYIIETILDIYWKLTLKTQNAAVSLKTIHTRLTIKKGKKNSIFLGSNSAISAIVILLEANENLLWICAHNTLACHNINWDSNVLMPFFACWTGWTSLWAIWPAHLISQLVKKESNIAKVKSG